MPVRDTKRGADRTPLSGHYDVLICGASFAGLTVARELQGSGARVLMVDRYEIGERQTSACAAPTTWLEVLGLESSIRQTTDQFLIHRPGRAFEKGPKTYRWTLPFSFSTFDYRELCALLRAQSPDTAFETAKVDGRTGLTVHTDRGDLSADLVIDALGWRRALAKDGQTIKPPDARMSRGLEVHPHLPEAAGMEGLELWLDHNYIPAGYGWAFPAEDELRIGWGSFEPRKHVKEETDQLTRDLGLEPNEYQGNWIPHKLREAADDEVFFVGDSAGHCLPLSAEGIRTAFYFGIAAGREARLVLEGRQSRRQALDRYAAFSDEHAGTYAWMLRTQTMVSKINRLPLMDTVLDLCDRPSFVNWSFGHYFRIADPAFAARDEVPGVTQPALAEGEPEPQPA